MKKERVPEKRVLTLPSRYLAGLFALLVLLFSGTALFEYHYRKSEIEHIAREEASLLIHALGASVENAITAYRENSATLTKSLFTQLRLLDRIDRLHPLTSGDISEITERSSNIYRIHVFDRNGQCVASNHPSDHRHSERRCRLSLALQPVLSGSADSVVIGIRQGPSRRGARLAAAIRRTRGGAIAGNVDATMLLKLSRKLGGRQLIERIGADTTGIDYIIWQDSSGIVEATPNVVRSAEITSDPFLLSVLRENKTMTRMTTFGGRQVFEVVKPFQYRNLNAGLLRIGLKTDHFTAALTKLRNRMILVLGLVCVGGLALFNLVVIRKNELFMQEAYDRVQTFSSGILESMADAVVAVDADACVTLLNRAAENLFAVVHRDAAGRSVEESFPCLAAFFDTVLREKTTLHKEFLCTTEGKTCLLDGHFSFIAGNADRSVGAIGVMRDLTEQRAMERVIERREKLTAMGELASGVAHEIRNPLNAIGIFAQRLDMEFTPSDDEPEYRKLVRAIVSEVHRVNAIIQRFLRFGRPPKPAFAPISPDDLIRSYLPVLHSEAESKGLDFSVDYGCLDPVPIDREQICQVLLNIVRNAVEATDTGGSIALRLLRREGGAVIEAADTGSGIPPEKQGLIFNPYVTTKSEGTGMGLSIANQIVHAHGGSIELESREGEGSLFRIVLPLA